MIGLECLKLVFFFLLHPLRYPEYVMETERLAGARDHAFFELLPDNILQEGQQQVHLSVIGLKCFKLVFFLLLHPLRYHKHSVGM